MAKCQILLQWPGLSIQSVFKRLEISAKQFLHKPWSVMVDHPFSGAKEGKGSQAGQPTKTDWSKQAKRTNAWNCIQKYLYWICLPPNMEFVFEYIYMIYIKYIYKSLLINFSPSPSVPSLYMFDRLELVQWCPILYLELIPQTDESTKSVPRGSRGPKKD